MEMANPKGILELMAAPDWAIDILVKLKRATGYGLNGEHRPVGIYTLLSEWPQRVGVTDQPHAFLHVREDQFLIILPPEASPEETRWRSVICHEFVHVLHWPVDKWVKDRVGQEEFASYMVQVEQMMRPMMILAMVATLVEMVWEENVDA